MSAESDSPDARDENEHEFQGVQTRLCETLVDKVGETSSQSAEFETSMQALLEGIRQAPSGEDIEQLRGELVDNALAMIHGNRSFARALDTTQDYLHVLETNSQQLSDELSRVRLLSLTDELTGLPNRRAFLRRMEDEVGRVQRYGFPLSLAVIDIDHFKEVNDRYGHSAGDDALKTYAREILSMFRHHDLVARYGGEEFVVLLPNTDEEGATRALHKVQRRAAQTTYQSNGDRAAVPMFSAGVAIYKTGETPSALIERADNALYEAKRLGRNRIEIDSSSQ